MAPRRNDPRHSFDRELKRAEKERRFMVTALAVGLMAVALVVAGVLSLRAGESEAAPSAIGTGAAGESAGAAGEPAVETGVDAAEDTGAASESATASQTAGAEAEPEREAAPAPEPAPKPAPKPAGTQRLSVGLGQFGYEPSTLTAKAGVPIELTVAQGQGCAAGFLIPGLGVSADNTQGPATVKLPALEAGTYRFYCGMQMVEGKLVVR